MSQRWIAAESLTLQLIWSHGQNDLPLMYSDRIQKAWASKNVYLYIRHNSELRRDMWAKSPRSVVAIEDAVLASSWPRT
jgi:hypothetical protein